MAIFDPRLAVNPRSVPPLQPFPVESFGGLDLRRDPQEVGWTGAIDLLNVEAEKLGRVHHRRGVTRFGTTTYGSAPDALHPFVINAGGNTFQILVSAGGTVYAIDEDGAIANTSSTNAGVVFVSHAAPGSSAVYYTNGSVSQVKKWNGSAFSSPAGLASYAPNALAVQMPDNRLVMAGLPSFPSRVQFSDGGTPETVTANSFVDLHPGDGEEVQAACSWRELTFVRKPSHVFVFYGNSTDGSGSPVFEYRTLDVPFGGYLGLTGATKGVRHMVAGSLGVYLLTAKGVYRTTGFELERISGPIGPVFGATVDHAYFQGSAISDLSATTLHAAEEKVFLSNATGTYVYDERTDAWGYWNSNSAPFSAATALRGLTYVAYKFAAGDFRVGTLDGSVATDNSATVTSRYRTGFADLGTPLAEKIMREVLMDGIGSPTVKVAVNDGSLDSGTAVTLGTSPATGTGRHRKSYRGRNFSLELGATTAWTVNRALAHVMGERPPGLKSA